MTRRQPSTPTNLAAGRSLTAADRITVALRERALAAQDGAYLGSEETLTTEFEVSRPTLRQAARRLEHEDILEVRRGINGGYFACRASLDQISQQAGTFLRSHLDSIDQIVEVLDALTPLIVDSMMRSGRIEELRRHSERTNIREKHEEFLSESIQLTTSMREIVDNPLLAFIMASCHQFGLSVPTEKKQRGDRTTMLVQENRVRNIEALLAGDRDAAIAGLIAQRKIIYDGLGRNMTTIVDTRSETKPD